MRYAQRFAELATQSDLWSLDGLKSHLQRQLESTDKILVELIERVVASHCERPAVRRLSKWLNKQSQFHQLMLHHGIRSRLVANCGRHDRSFKTKPDWKIPEWNTVHDLTHFLGLDLRSIHQFCNSSCYHYYLTRKRTIGWRIIESPDSWLKAAQRKLVSELLEKIPVHSNAHGMVKGRSILTATQNHVGRSWVLKMDLQDFFPSISSSRIAGFFNVAGYSNAVSNALARICTNVVPLRILHGWQGFLTRQQLERLRRAFYRPHLPQGAPTSPGIANLLAYTFDQRLTGLARTWKMKYTRYADDLIFSTNRASKRQLVRFADQVGAVAIEEGFLINYRKTRLLPQSQQQRVLGVVLNQKVNLDRKDFDQLKAILHNCVNDGPDSQNKDGVLDFRSVLRGRIEWAKRINPIKAQRLQRLFDNIEWDKAQNACTDPRS